MTEDADSDLREAWRRKKAGVDLDERHEQAMRSYYAEWNAGVRRTSLPAALMSDAEKAAAARGVKVHEMVAQLVRLEISNQLITRESHTGIVKEFEKKVLRLERRQDDLRDEAAEGLARARKAESDAAAAAEEIFLTQERMISLLDFMGVPDVDASDFLAPTDTGNTVGMGDAEA